MSALEYAFFALLIILTTLLGIGALWQIQREEREYLRKRENSKMPTTPRTDADRTEITFADALALQAVEAFVERVMARYVLPEYSMYDAVVHELEAWREAVPDEARKPDATTDA